MDLRVVFVGLLAAVTVRVVFHFIDKNRIQREIESHGGRVLSINWNPFARGWFFEKNERHYDVTYLDRTGATLSHTCKTSFLPACIGPKYRQWSICPESPLGYIVRSAATLYRPIGKAVPTAAKL